MAQRERRVEEALERLVALVRAAAVQPKRRVPTRPTRASQERRIEGKKARSAVKRLRQGPEVD
ncbi:MAG: hypothetical protein AAFV49_05665 [Pseudomonadota bacterium]